MPTVDGYPVKVFTLRHGPRTAVLTDLGARLLELHVPDRDGRTADVVLGRKTLEETLADENYFGAIAGRYAGRIRRGRFTLDGHEHQLTANENANHLHGGHRGFDKHVWSARQHPNEPAVTFARISPDGEEGYPGDLTAWATYRLTEDGLEVEMRASTTSPTIVRLVHHSYFNLGGHDSGSVLDHEVQIASTFLPELDEELVGTGQVLGVEGTPFDFREARRIGERNFDVDNAGAGRLEDGASAGFDHIWGLDGHGLRHVGTFIDPTSGRRMDLITDQPGLCFYVGGYTGGLSAKGDLEAYAPFAGFTLETTGYPDDANIPHFPPPVLRPGERYVNRMHLAFSTV